MNYRSPVEVETTIFAGGNTQYSFVDDAVEQPGLPMLRDQNEGFGYQVASWGHVPFVERPAPDRLVTLLRREHPDDAWITVGQVPRPEAERIVMTAEYAALVHDALAASRTELATTVHNYDRIVTEARDKVTARFVGWVRDPVARERAAKFARAAEGFDPLAPIGPVPDNLGPWEPVYRVVDA